MNAKRERPRFCNADAMRDSVGTAIRMIDRSIDDIVPKKLRIKKTISPANSNAEVMYFIDFFSFVCKISMAK